jgi:hypothetical protein
MQLIKFIEDFYIHIEACINEFNIILKNTLSIIDISYPDEETDFNQDIDKLIEDAKVGNKFNRDVDKFINKIGIICKSFREKVNDNAEILILISAFRRDDGMPMMDFFSKNQVDPSRNIKKIRRNKTEFMTQIMGDGSYLGCFYKVIIVLNY